MFTSRGLKGGEWYEVYPTLRCYVCKLITRIVCRGHVEMSFKRGNFGKFLTSATPSSLDGMHQPLPQAFPEYCVVKRPNGIHEFRVEAQSYFRSRNASASYYTGIFDWALVLIFPILGAVAWRMVCTLLVYIPMKLH